MFDFEKLDVYQEVKVTNSKVLGFIFTSQNLDPYLRDQWKRATINILLNIAEGTGRMTFNDKRNFFTIARSSVFECIAILDTVLGLGFIKEENYKEFYEAYEKISKMLLGMIRSFTKQ
ncbi:hypothetical protein BH23BAC1_BH23BAC1_46370 [soil metagenome]